MPTLPEYKSHEEKELVLLDTSKANPSYPGEGQGHMTIRHLRNQHLVSIILLFDGLRRIGKVASQCKFLISAPRKTDQLLRQSAIALQLVFYRAAATHSTNIGQ